MNFTLKNFTITSLFVCAVMFGSLSLVSFNAYALKPSATCPSGQVMKGSIRNNNVSCFKAGSKRKNKPACVTKRYRMDAAGIKDKCVKKNKPDLKKKWTQPRCITGGKYKAVRGYDECRNTKKTTKRFYCKQGWTMKGNTSANGGRGKARCSQPGKKLGNKPACVTKRYRMDAAGIKDKCVKKNKPDLKKKWTQPRCIGGKYKAVKGYDQCRSSGKNRHPWKR